MFDNEYVSQRSGCSTYKNGTLCMPSGRYPRPKGVNTLFVLSHKAKLFYSSLIFSTYCNFRTKKWVY